MSVNVIERYVPEEISRDQDRRNLQRMIEEGFMVMKLSSTVLLQIRESLLEKIKMHSEFHPDHENIKGGYSIGAGHLLVGEHRKYFEDFGNFLCKQKFVRDYVNLPKLVDISVMYTLYNAEAAATPTHAHLWHRDGGDSREYITIEIPLVACTAANGMFSVMSKRVCSKEKSLRDAPMIERFSGMLANDYRHSDHLYRLSDPTVRGSIAKENIFDFENELGDALLVDTGRCYHKGAHILGPGEYRLMVQLMIGGLSHDWRAGQTVLRQRMINGMYRIAGKRPVRRVPGGDIFLGRD